MAVTRRGLMMGASAAALAGCGGARPVVVDAWTGLVADLAQQLATAAPERAPLLPISLQPPRFRRLLSDYSALGEERRRTGALRRLAQITGFDPAEIPAGRQARHDAVVERLRAAGDLAQLSVGRLGGDGGLRPYAVDPIRAAGVALPALLDAAPPFADLADAQAFVDRVKAAPEAIAGDLAAAQADAERGFVLPQLLLDRTVSVFDVLAATPLEAFPARLAFVERAIALGGALDGPKPSSLAMALRGLLGEVDQAIRTGWVPAYQRTAAALRGLRPRAPALPSYARAPEPLVLYRRCLDAVLGRWFDPTAARAAAETRLASLQVALDGMLRAQGFADGSVGARLARVRAAPRPEALDPASLRAKILAEVAAFSAAAGAAFGQRFGPQAPPPLAAFSAPSWRGPIGLGGGYRHADGAAHAALWVALPDPSRFSPLDQVILSAREGAPGRHVAEALAGVADDPVSSILRLLPSPPTALGWSAYALSLSDDMGLTQSDPWASIGLQAGQLQIAAAALLEFDLNSADAAWEAALASYMEATGDSRAQAERLGERILFEPGYGLAAEMGRAHIATLRDHARTALGDRFDAKSFHTVVLAATPGPLSYLTRSVEEWIARR